MKNCILFMLTLSVALLSCSKEKLETIAAAPELSAVSKEIVEAASAAPEYPPVPKVKSSIPAGAVVGIYYYYDSLGRLSRIHNLNGDDYQTTFRYSTDKIIRTHYEDYPSGFSLTFDTLFLNSLGLVTSIALQSNPFYSPAITYYEYNEARYLINKKTKYRSGTLLEEYKYYYTNNRLDSAVAFNSDGSRKYVFKFTNYDLTKKHTLNAYNYGQYYLGRQSAIPYLKSQAQNVYSGNNQTPSTQLISYLYDAKGRMINKISKAESGNILSNTNFTYY